MSGETFRYLGRQHRLRVIAGPADAAVKLDRGWLVVAVPRLPDAARAPAVRAAVIRWYRARAEERLPERAGAWAAKLELPAPAVLVRDQRRRWGSCSRTHEIRLNWRILQAPLSLIDYVVAHELAHMVCGDAGHGPAFWAELGRVMPDYDVRRDRLRELGPALEW